MDFELFLVIGDSATTSTILVMCKNKSSYPLNHFDLFLLLNAAESFLIDTPPWDKETTTTTTTTKREKDGGREGTQNLKLKGLKSI